MFLCAARQLKHALMSEQNLSLPLSFARKFPRTAKAEVGKKFKILEYVRHSFGVNRTGCDVRSVASISIDNNDEVEN